RSARMSSEESPEYSPFFAVMGASAAMVFSETGRVARWGGHRSSTCRGMQRGGGGRVRPTPGRGACAPGAASGDASPRGRTSFHHVQAGAASPGRCWAVTQASTGEAAFSLGAAYGTAKSGTGIAAMSVMRPELIMKSIIPVVMAGIIAIYGLVVAVLIANNISERVSLYKSFLHLGAGLSVGLSGLAAGFAIGIVGDAGVRGTAQQPRLFVGMILILIFAEVLGLYGLIVALILSTK
ncbi:unnamed protein product, partial [Menidia menidia]